MEAELRRRQAKANEERDPTRARARERLAARRPVRTGEGRIEVDEREYELLMKIAAGAKTVKGKLEQTGLPVMDPTTWSLLYDSLDEVAHLFRWAGDTGMENQIADLLELARDLAADG